MIDLTLSAQGVLTATLFTKPGEPSADASVQAINSTRTGQDAGAKELIFLTNTCSVIAISTLDEKL